MKIERDKILHVIAGIGVYLAVAAALGPVSGLLAAIAAGVGKELYDVWDSDRRLAAGLAPRATPDPADFAATAAGGVFGLALHQVALLAWGV